MAKQVSKKLWLLLVVRRKVKSYKVVTTADRIYSPRPRYKNGVTSRSSAFTLVELSIVLVIIGLLAGGVLVGGDLIKASEIRAQVSQIERYNTAVKTFKLKYGGIPGDLLATDAQAFGFFASTYGPGMPLMASSLLGNGRPFGDANGILESGDSTIGCGASAGNSNCQYAELLMFWRHLSGDAKLIEGNYSKDYIVGTQYGIQANSAIATSRTTPDTINLALPFAKAGKNSFIMVNSYQGINYFSLIGIDNLSGVGYFNTVHNPLSAQEAYKIDIKIDDGKPNTGVVRAIDRSTAGHAPALWINLSANTNCVTGGTDYTLSNENIASCSLSFKFQ